MASSNRQFAFAMALAFVPALFSEDQATQQYSRKQLREMASQAHTAEDHQRLADYYRGQERSFRKLEAEQRQALDDYNKGPQNSHSKYPSRGHTARHLASYYSQQAEKSAVSAAAQEKLAAKHT